MTIETSMSLDKIETGFTVFETDQVLTPQQLNGVADYLDDQERLTRVALVGVGIACGLWPSLQEGIVRLSQGVGTTTDGDVLFMPGATVYDRYKPYDESAPKYPPFYPDGQNMIDVYELVLVGESDNRALPLVRFATSEGRPLESMAVVLYTESYLHDPDVCTATDCDNRGRNSVHATKVLLVDVRSASALTGALDTPDGAARSLEPVAVARPVLQGALATEADLAAVYRNVCSAILKTLQPALDAVYKPCRWFLRDLMPANPAPEWQRLLAEIVRASAPARGVQYRYDFLKDVAETYNAFRDTLFGDTAVCCPALDAFPKHLVAGSLDPALRRAAGRTASYPSPMVSERFERRAHARFLFRKLDTLIRSFAIPETRQIRITPSAFEDRSLEERAIPFYYTVSDQLPVHRLWSYRLTHQGMESYNYSYNADRYSAAGAAAAPLQSQIGAFDFFRIEGHIGRRVAEVDPEINTLIVGGNLAIDYVYLSLGQAPSRPPPRWNTHLHDLQYLMRADLAAQLDDAGKFGTTFLDQIKTATAAKVVNDDDNKGVPVFGTAQTKLELMAGKATAARAKILSDVYDSESNWQDDVAHVAQAAAEMNESLSAVTKKDFVTPLDAVIAPQSTRWLTWVDTLIKDGNDDFRLPRFLAAHPGLEHYAGVARGGIFAMVVDANDVVIADFMLPYSHGGRQLPPPPPKLVPLPRPDIVFTKPIRMVTIPDKFRVEQIRIDVGNELKKDLAQQTKYFDAFKDSVSVLAQVKGGVFGQSGGPVIQPGVVKSDPLLGLNVTDMTWKTQKVDALREQMLDPSLDDSKRATIQKQLNVAESELASAILTTTDYVAKTGIDVTSGSDGAAAMGAASGALTKVGNIENLARIEQGLGDVGKRTGTTPAMNRVIGNLLAGRGMM